MAKIIKHCVQCKQSYDEADNVPGSCSFHRYVAPCCGQKTFCKHGAHRDAHHQEYPYETFFTRAYDVMRYTDTIDVFASVKDDNLDATSKIGSQEAMVGRLLRWVSKAMPVSDPLLVVCVGTLHPDQPHFFRVYKQTDLPANAATEPIIFDTAQSTGDNTSFARAEWITNESGAISGIRISAKAPTSQIACITQVQFDTATFQQVGTAQVISTTFKSFRPSRPYRLPQNIHVGTHLLDRPMRSAQAEFECVSTGCPVKLMVTSSPPLSANTTHAYKDRDVFTGILSVYNKSKEPITIASVSAAFRLLGVERYTPAMSIEFKGSQMPLTIDLRSVVNLTFDVHVPRTPEDTRLGVVWWNRAFIARRNPLRLKLTVRDMEDQQAYVLAEYVYHQPRFDQSSSDEIGFAFLDDIDMFERNRVSVRHGWNGSVVIDSRELSVTDLNRIVYLARMTGCAEVDLHIDRNIGDGVCVWNAWALVDLHCNRVYAFKILMQQGDRFKVKTRATLTYIECPEYGEISDETREPLLAEERVSFPTLQNEVIEAIVWDDSFDDEEQGIVEPYMLEGRGLGMNVPAAMPIAAAAAVAATSQASVIASLEARISSLSTQLERTNETLNKLVAVMQDFVAKK